MQSIGYEKRKIAQNDDVDCIGFIEGKLYRNKNEKYGFVESWYVIPKLGKKGVGFMLMDTLGNWFSHCAIENFYFDTIPEEYPTSASAHNRNGYKILRFL